MLISAIHMYESAIGIHMSPPLLVEPPSPLNLSPSFSKNILFFWPYYMACGILVPQAGIKPMVHAVEAQNLNHWTTREVSSVQFLMKITILVNKEMCYFMPMEGKNLTKYRARVSRRSRYDLCWLDVGRQREPSPSWPVMLGQQPTARPFLWESLTV